LRYLRAAALAKGASQAVIIHKVSVCCFVNIYFHFLQQFNESMEMLGETKKIN